MTLKLNKEVTREQLEELGFDYNSSKNNEWVEFDFRDNDNRSGQVSINLEDRIIIVEIKDDNYGKYSVCEIPTIIKTMIERGYC